MGKYLDIDDVCHGTPVAMQELADLRAEISMLRAALVPIIDLWNMGKVFSSSFEISQRMYLAIEECMKRLRGAE